MNDEDDDPLLPVSPEALLLAAMLAKDYIPQGYTDTKHKLSKHRDMALDWVDWAVCNSDLGRLLVEARAEAALTRKGDGKHNLGLPPI